MLQAQLTATPRQTGPGVLERAARWLKRVSTPPRIQGFEFCDQSWLKGCWREAHLDGMNFMFKLFGLHQRLHRAYGKWAREAGYAEVLDLASGGVGHIDTLLTESRKEGVTLPRITVSDLFPDRAAFERLKAAHGERVNFIADSVDATQPLPRAAPLLSICSAFHHLPPDVAKKLLANATANSNGIFIAEIFNRSVWSPFLSLPNLLILMAAPFFSQRCTLKKVLISTVVPIVPMMIVFDGIISALRTYTPEEILALVPEEARREWTWASGSTRYFGIFSAPYFCGYRKR